MRRLRMIAMRAAGLSVALTMLMLAAALSLPAPADVVRGFAAMSAAMLATMHFIAMGTLRGLRRAGIAEAQDAMNATRDPRRISAFDLAMTWLLIAGIARYCA